jgi:hypothetical protein
MAYNRLNGSVNGIRLVMIMSVDRQVSMGRPPLGMKPTTIRLPAETIQRIETLVGNRRVARFIREAIENELQRRENLEPAK